MITRSPPDGGRRTRPLVILLLIALVALGGAARPAVAQPALGRQIRGSSTCTLATRGGARPDDGRAGALRSIAGPCGRSSGRYTCHDPTDELRHPAHHGRRSSRASDSVKVTRSPQDHLCTLADQIIKVRGERSRLLRPGRERSPPRQRLHLSGDRAPRARARRERSQRAGGSTRSRPGLRRRLQRLPRRGRSGGRQGLLPGRALGAPDQRARPPRRTFRDLPSPSRARVSLGSRFHRRGAAAQAPRPRPSSPRRSSCVSGFRPAVGLGSNGWAIGGELLGDGTRHAARQPALPLDRRARFWESHLMIPGELDVYGVSLIGLPASTSASTTTSPGRTPSPPADS